MTAFGRRFDVAALAKWDAAHPGNTVRALFARWALPGRYHRNLPLRVGVRNGSLNLYVKGQSVAKLTLGRGGPRLELHRKYATLTRRGSPLPETDETGSYLVHRAPALASPALAAAVPDWIATALSYADMEKSFVDELIRANPEVIDLEMGLPPTDGAGAPRMDLVLARRTPADGRFAIEFWEAKMASNGELRARAEYLEENGERRAGAKVIAQLRRYQRWMEHGDHVAEVAAAYRTTGAILAALHDTFGNRHEAEPEPVTGWRRLAVCDAVTVVTRPGVVIGNELPDGFLADAPVLVRQRARTELARAANSFERHRDRLIARGITVREIGSADPWADVGSTLAFLPRLQPGAITS